MQQAKLKNAIFVRRSAIPVKIALRLILFVINVDCRKIGHFSRVRCFQLIFLSQPCTTRFNSTEKLNIFSSKQDSGSKINVMMQLNGQPANALLDTGVTSEKIVERLEFPVTKTFTCINLALKGYSSQTIGLAKTR